MRRSICPVLNLLPNSNAFRITEGFIASLTARLYMISQGIHKLTRIMMVIEEKKINHTFKALENLLDTWSFLGEEQVRMKNGKVISISNIGSTMLKSLTFNVIKLNYMFHKLASHF